MEAGVSDGEAAGEARPRSIVLVRSPKAGRSAKGAVALKALRDCGVEVREVLDVSALDQHVPFGRTWRERGYDAAVAAGGDGTIGAVASQLAGSGLPLGILPLGTSNDTARSLGIPLDLGRAAEVIARGAPSPVDAGMALPATTEPFALSSESPAPQTPEYAARIVNVAARGAYFLHALTLGLNVAFARLATDIARRERFGRLNYAAAALEALTHFDPVPVTLRLSGVRRWSAWSEPPDADGNLVVHCDAIQVAAVNLPVFGGNLNFHLPRVETRDSLLDFVLIEAPQPHVIREAIEGWLGAHRELTVSRRGSASPQAQRGMPHATASDEAGFNIPGVRRYQAYTAAIETPEPVDVTLDGEVRARTPAVVCVTPEPVRVLLPSAADDGQAGNAGNGRRRGQEQQRSEVRASPQRAQHARLTMRPLLPAPGRALSRH
jgi:diacylglycerol kinase (ATP)